MELWMVLLGLGLIALYGWWISKPGPQDLEGQAEAVGKKYNTNDPALLAKLKAYGHKQRANQLGYARSEVESATHLKEAPQRLEWELELQKEAVKLAQDTNLLSEYLISKALEKELDVAALVEVNKKLAFDRGDLDKRWEEIEQDLKAGFIFANKEKEYFKLFQQFIFGLYDERKKIEAGEEPARDDKLSFYNEWVKDEEREFKDRRKYFREQQEKLLQAATPKDV